MAEDGSSRESRPLDEEARALAFGPFVFERRRELLHRDGEPVPLPPKPAQVLGCLLDRAGEVVSKGELLDEVWPDTHVIEHSLTEAIHVIRRELGDDARNPTYVQTVPRRGYRFVADVRPVESVLADDGPEATVAWPGSRPLWRRWLAAAVLAAVPLVALLAVLASSSNPSADDAAAPDGPSQQMIARYPFASGEPNPGVTNALSPDGHRLAFVPVNPEIHRLVVRDLRSGRDLVPHANQPASLTAGSASQMGYPAWSPDGASIAYVWEIRDDDAVVSQIRVVPAAGGTPDKIYEGRDERLIIYDWSPDGEWILFARGLQPRKWRATVGHQLLELSLGDRSSEPDVRIVEEYGDHGWSSGGSYAPDGDRLAYDTRSGDHRGVVVASRSTGRRERITPSSVRDEAPEWSPDGRYLFVRRTIGDRRSFVLQPLEGLEPAGEAVTVLDDVGNRLHHDWSAGDRLLYHQRVRGGTIYRLPLDRSSLQPTGPPMPLSEGLWGRLRDYFVATPAEGEFLVMVDTSDGWRPHLVSETRERRLALPAGYRTRRVVGSTPDGRVVLLARIPDGPEKIIRLDPSTGRTEELVEPPSTDHRFTGSSLSPEGDRVTLEHVVRGADGVGVARLLILDLESGESEELSVEGSSFWTAWSPDGRRLAVSRAGADGFALLVVPVDGGPAREVASAARSIIGRPTWSPDQRWLAFVSTGVDRRARVRVVPSGPRPEHDLGRILYETDPGERPGTLHWSSDGTALYMGTGGAWIQLWVMEDLLAEHLVTER